MRRWTPADSEQLYGVGSWGGGYFSVGDDGELHVHPYGKSEGEPEPSLGLHTLVRELRGRGLSTPLLLRFSDVLRSRVRELAGCFERAIEASGYRGRYRGVYPIKANQQRQVVEEIVAFGRESCMGLEAGSKPELLVGMALLETEGALLICNGYKDAAYVEMALLAQKLGRHVIVVIERPSELDLVLKTARSLGVTPCIGVRVRLATRGTGKWIESSGDRSKFGLSASEIVDVVRRLRSEDALASLELVHFHLGSQVTSIRSHKDALREASRVFAGLHQLGASVRYLDVGGGLGVDYDGSQSQEPSSMNYSVQEYASDVIGAIAEACADSGAPHPDVVTESGRALVSHASVLVFDVLGVDSLTRRESVSAPGPDEHRVIHDLWRVRDSVTPATALESHHDAQALKEEASVLFSHGYLDLMGRARAEEIYWSCCRAIQFVVSGLEFVPEELADLPRTLADTYYCNFSVFQSLPDTWTMGQLFPVMPLHRLDEAPTRLGTLADLTCDSDGKLDRFIDRQGMRGALELHEPDGRPYHLGVFLVGAYQETLGELHNLFGDTDTVHVHVDADGTRRIEQVIEGDSVAEVLAYVQYSKSELVERVRRATRRALRNGTLGPDEVELLERRLERVLEGSTYLEPGDGD
jgi:arginine decarboxylase